MQLNFRVGFRFTVIVFITLFYAFAFTHHPTPTFATADPGWFTCIYQTGFGCDVNISTAACVIGYTWEESYCDNFSEPDCNSAPPHDCILIEQTLFRCVPGTGCIPCTAEQEGCVYQNQPDCNIACTTAGTPYRCTPNGCTPDNSCGSGGNGCFDNQHDCEYSGCVVNTPTPYPDCSTYTDSASCENNPTCWWDSSNNLCRGGTYSVSDGPPLPLQICDTIPTTQPDQQAKCRDCLTGKGGIYTAVGCFPTTSEGFTGAVLTLALSIGGGVALLLMVYGGFLFATAGGNPEAAQKGKEVFVGAIIGLLFIIFSVTLLNVIGIDILQLPGL